MNGEAFVGVILQASLIAIGLLMAIFSIILPSIKTILEIRFTEFLKLADDLEKSVKELKQSPKNLTKELDVKLSDILFYLQKYKSHLPFNNYYILIVIILYASAVLTSTHWYFVDVNYQGNYLVIIGVIFAIATTIFVYIAIQTIRTIFKVIESISNDIYSQMQESRIEKEKLVKEFMDSVIKK